MRKALLTGVLGLALIMGACTNTEGTKAATTNINLYTATEKNHRDVLELKEKDITSEDFKLMFQFEKDMVKISVINTSDEVIVVDWDEARYTGLDGEEQRIFNMKHKERGLYTRQMASSLRPGQSDIAELVPVNNLHYTPGGSTGLGTIYIEKKLFVNEMAEKKQDFAKIYLPITLNGVKKGTLHKYEIYFGKGDMPAELTEELANKKAAVVILPATQPVQVQQAEAVTEIKDPEVLKIQKENDIMEQEIKDKEELIKQLNEKAKLKKELEEKQKEIDALINQLN